MLTKSASLELAPKSKNTTRHYNEGQDHIILYCLAWGCKTIRCDTRQYHIILSCIGPARLGSARSAPKSLFYIINVNKRASLELAPKSKNTTRQNNEGQDHILLYCLACGYKTIRYDTRQCHIVLSCIDPPKLSSARSAAKSLFYIRNGNKKSFARTSTQKQEYNKTKHWTSKTI